MQAYTVATIQQEIRSYKKICATQRKLEANLLASKNHPSSQKKQLKRYKEKKQMIENWLSLLNDDELFVIQRHLIDEVIWSQLEEEYAARTPFPKCVARSCVIRIRRSKRFFGFCTKPDAVSRVTILSLFCRCFVTLKSSSPMITCI